MQGNKSRDTRPEMALRRELHRRGLRYRVHAQPLPLLSRKADLVFPAARVAVFVDGCFWHRCPEHGNAPRANSLYWSAKLDRNVARDRHTEAALTAAGWHVIRVWEHEDCHDAADIVALVVLARGKSSP